MGQRFASTSERREEKEGKEEAGSAPYWPDENPTSTPASSYRIHCTNILKFNRMTFPRNLLLLAFLLKVAITDAASSYLPRLMQKAIPQGRIPYSVNVLHSGVVNVRPN